MKGNSPEETLLKGKRPSGNAGLSAPGNSQAKPERANAMSNQEALGNPPAPEKVRSVKMDTGAQKKAYSLNKRSQEGGANPSAFADCE
jgi:hypothetical protein